MRVQVHVEAKVTTWVPGEGVHAIAAPSPETTHFAQTIALHVLFEPGVAFVQSWTGGFEPGSIASTDIPVLHSQPIIRGGTVTVRQSVGVRVDDEGTPRLEWSTLEVVVREDGTYEASIVSASANARHSLSGPPDDEIFSQTALIDLDEWRHRDPSVAATWGTGDLPRVVTSSAPSLLERQVAIKLLAVPDLEVLTVQKDQLLASQGSRGDTVFVVLNGLIDASVDGKGVLFRAGPGTILGERAVVEHAKRTASLRAGTDAVVAEMKPEGVPTEKLQELAKSRKREFAGAARTAYRTV